MALGRRCCRGRRCCFLLDGGFKGLGAVSGRTFRLLLLLLGFFVWGLHI